MTQQKNQKLWGGRFVDKTNTSVENFSESVSFDSRLWREDIRGSIAHATMLCENEVLKPEEADEIIQGLEGIAQDIEAGNFQWETSLEDVHLNIEAALTQRIGENGKKLHTARSRNDQVALDVRLWLRGQVIVINDDLVKMQQNILKLAEQEIDTIMPGFTHLQTAQPITFAHHLLAWNEMIQRDRERLRDMSVRLNQSPLGACALAGTGFATDSKKTAQMLGFQAPCSNALDAVSDRDFMIEFCSFASIVAMHLSRMSEEIILWMSSHFDFIDIEDAFCTGSSIMPQKKNPDVAELTRGKSGRVFGNLIALLTLMKAQPLAYNRDNQEDKKSLFETVDILRETLPIFTKLIAAITPKRNHMLKAAGAGYATATDFADYLVRLGISFRDAHSIAGRAVHMAQSQDLALHELSFEGLQELEPKIERSIFDILDVEGSVASRTSYGGTAPSEVNKQLERARLAIDRVVLEISN